MGSEMLFLAHNKQEKMKSSFTQTCTRFSQFLKERRATLGHLDASELQIKGAKELCGSKNNSNAINLFPKKLEKGRVSLELFPLTNSLTVAGTEDPANNMAESSELPIPKEEPKNVATPSMTIFYDGRVLVFNELPEDKVREIMSLARRGTMSSPSQPQIQTQTQSQTPTPKSVNTITNNHLKQNDVVPQGVSSLADLPIARRVSLHRFMEKRKHRIAASAPYQLHNSFMTIDDSHPQKINMMRNLFEQQQLELKL